MKVKKFYLNIFFNDVDPEQKLQSFKKEIRHIAVEFGQKICAKDLDHDEAQLVVSYKGNFADLAVFADNIINYLQNQKGRVYVYFSDEPILGDSLCIWSMEQIYD